MKETITSRSMLQDFENLRKRLFYDYDEKYFNLWLASRRWEGISKEQRRFIMRQFWGVGKVCAFSLINTSVLLDGQSLKDIGGAEMIGFANFAPQSRYNIYNEPTKVRPISVVPNRWIPNKNLVVGKEVVIGYVQGSRQPLRTLVWDYISRMVDVDIAIKINEYATTTSIVFKTNDGNQQELQNFINAIAKRLPAIVVKDENQVGLETPVKNPPFLITDLYAYKCSLENELCTYLGIDNIGNVEKRSRLLKDEANSNNALINAHAIAIDDNLNEFCDDINALFGLDISQERAFTLALADGDGDGLPDDKQKGETANDN